MTNRMQARQRGIEATEDIIARREHQHPRQTFFDSVIRALDVHLPETPQATKIAIATDAALFGTQKGPG